MHKLLGSNKKIIKDTNWKPEFSGHPGFKKALLETYDWFKDQKIFLFIKIPQNIIYK